MYDPLTGWKWELFADLLPTVALQKIASFELYQEEDSHVSYFWNPSSSGDFTLKSAIEMIKKDDTLDLGFNWTLPWRVHAPQKVRLFLWLVLHDRILSNTNRFKKNLTDDPRYSVCGEEETTLYLLRDCVKARKVWSLIHEVTVSDFSFSSTLEDWIGRNLTQPSKFDVDNWPTLFALTVWWIWRWRNCPVFDREEEIPKDQFCFLMRMLWETISALRKDENLFNQRNDWSKEVFVRWSPPPFDWVVLSIDGASRGNPGLSGAGGLLRKADGNL